MSNINNIIYNYSRGFHYQRLKFDDFICIYGHEILKLADEYGVKPENYDTSEADIRNFCGQFKGQVADDYWSYVNDHKDNQETTRGFIFCTLATIAITIVAALITPYLVITFPLIGFVVWKYLFPPYNEWCNKKNLEKFIEKHHLEMDGNAERFINEVMFQAYLRNRNAVEESKYVWKS